MAVRGRAAVLALVLAALAVGASAPAPARAQYNPVPILQLVAAVLPDDDGGPRVQVGMTLNRESFSTPRAIAIGLPAGVRLAPRAFEPCGLREAASRPCPRRALVGRGRLTTLLGDWPIRYDVWLFANGARQLTAVLRSKATPKIIQAQSRVRLSRHGLRMAIPPVVQEPIPGAPVNLTNVRLDLGPATAAGEPFVRVRPCAAATETFSAAVDLVRKALVPAVAEAEGACDR